MKTHHTVITFIINTASFNVKPDSLEQQQQQKLYLVMKAAPGTAGEH